MRVLALYSLSRTGYIRVLLIDEQLYHTWASELAAGTFVSTGAYKVSPLPAYLIALGYRLFGSDAFYFRSFNIILASATCGMLFWLGKTLASRHVGLGAAFLAAIYKPFILYSIVPLKTVLEVFLFILTLLLFAQAINNRSVSLNVLLGLSIGSLIATRENAVVFPFVVGPFLMWNDLQGVKKCQPAATRAAALLAGLALILAPFCVRNYITTGEPVLTTHQAGFNFYMGNQLDTMSPYYRPVAFASSNPFELETHFRIEASRRLGRFVTSGTSERYWVGLTVDRALSNPALFLQKQAYKVLALLNPAEAGDHYDAEFLGQFAHFFAIPLPTFMLVMPLGITGLILSASRSRPSLGILLSLPDMPFPWCRSISTVGIGFHLLSRSCHLQPCASEISFNQSKESSLPQHPCS
jgi:4-amino-4-deoxy-L-arabinose transferase-like glycosyltransferase